MQLKICNKCKEEKPETDFYWDSHHVNYHYTCKACEKVKLVARYNTYFKTENGRKKWLEASLRAREKYPEKWKARTLLREAVRKGEVIKPDECSMCNISSACFGKLHAHHPDYSKPLDVKWLCQKHHQEEHARLRLLTP